MDRRGWLYCGFLLLGCGDDEGGGGGSDGSGLARQVTQKLQQCDIVGRGEHNPLEVEDSYDRCVATCLIDADCADLEAAYCDDAPSELDECIDACDDSPSDGFECEDGSTIPHSWACDDEPDCEGGEDEEGCKPYVCEDGEKVVDGGRCDGFVDCGDESDEDGCALACVAR